MTDSARDYLKQWRSPGVIMGLVGWVLLAVGAWYRLSALETRFLELSDQVKLATTANQQAKEESIRTQERLINLTARLESLERFREAQSDYNASTLASLAVLKKGG